MANLLLNLDSFNWKDLTLNRALEMENLILAVDKASDWEDTIFGHPDAYNSHLGWGTINDLLLYDEQECLLFTDGWFTNDHQKILIKLWRNPTVESARNITELEAEFPGYNNGLIGCEYEPLPNKMVYDEESLAKLHRDYVGNNPELRYNNVEYFYLHYSPVLRLSPSAIKQQIEKKQVHSSLKRLDLPTLDPLGVALHGEQIGIHFNDRRNSCLYIDGTWKHGNFQIPAEAKRTLEDWGFVIPFDQR